MAQSACVRTFTFPVLLLLLLMTALFIPSAAWAEAAKEKRVALVIGNNAYAHATPLDNPRNDAEAIANALVRLDFDTILRFDLDQHGMQQTLRDFEARIQDADVALFYYAGHGLQTRGRNYLVSTNADLRSESDLHFNTVDLQIVLDFMQDPERTSIVILDACRDNPLADQLASSLPKSRSIEVHRGLAKVESGVGTLVAFATAPGDYALDGLGEHSPFGQSLLRHIETPGLEVRQLFSRVRDDVYRSTDGVQVPWDNSSLRADFYFKPEIKLASVDSTGVAAETTSDATITPADANDAKAAEDVTTKAEFLFWETIKNDQTPENYADFLRLFPDSIFAGVAKQRLDAYSDRSERQVVPIEDTPPETEPALETEPSIVTEILSRPQPQTKPQPEPHPKRIDDAAATEAVAALAEEAVQVRIANAPGVAVLPARGIAEGWRRRTYALRGKNVHGCHGTGRETTKVGEWVAAELEASPIRLQSPHPDQVAAFASKTFDVAADLGVRSDADEIVLVEDKQAVGRSHAWCAYEVLSDDLFSSMLAGTAFFPNQELTTIDSGFTHIGWMEFAFGLVVVEGLEGTRNCLAFAGFEGSRRVDGYLCRAVGVPVDAAEVDAILARVAVDGVAG